jgi:hypothetical protein
MRSALTFLGTIAGEFARGGGAFGPSSRGGLEADHLDDLDEVDDLEPRVKARAKSSGSA